MPTKSPHTRRQAADCDCKLQHDDAILAVLAESRNFWTQYGILVHWYWYCYRWGRSNNAAGQRYDHCRLDEEESSRQRRSIIGEWRHPKDSWFILVTEHLNSFRNTFPNVMHLAPTSQFSSTMTCRKHHTAISMISAECSLCLTWFRNDERRRHSPLV